MDMLFKLISQNFQDASYYKKDDVDFLLEEDRWNDYDYYTQYHLHATAKITGDKGKGAEYLGPINIMRQGQEEDEKYLLREYFGEKPFHRLPEGFYSFSSSIGLYESLHRLLPARRRQLFIKNLRLILSAGDEYYKAVETDDCFNTSLLRWSDMNGLGIQTGRNLLLDQQSQYNLRRETLTVSLNYSGSPLTFRFSPLDVDDIPGLPNGTIAFIGKNGAGKSSVLYDIAALMYSNLNERETLAKKIGMVEPKDITMSRLLMFSYNPFDNFLLPGEFSHTDLLQWARKVNDRSGRFIFCGFRDVEEEAKLILKQQTETEKHKEENTDTENKNNCYWLHNKKIRGIPRKPITELAHEAHSAYREIIKDSTRKKLWQSMISRLEARHEELCVPLKQLHWADDGLDLSWSDVFGRLSTGHKFFFHAMTHAFAYTKPNSMLLFDEPENHLQWPLLGFMMQELRILLSYYSSVMLVATHSPAIVQDMLSENIRIVRRVGDKIIFQKPRIETYCESFGEISTEVFDLTPDRISFFDTLSNLYRYLDCDDCDSASDAVSRVKDCLGNISIQTIHFVVQLWMASHNKDK